MAAGSLTGGLAGPLHGRHEEGRKAGDDRHHDHQFDERERRLAAEKRPTIHAAGDRILVLFVMCHLCTSWTVGFFAAAGNGIAPSGSASRTLSTEAWAIQFVRHCEPPAFTEDFFSNLRANQKKSSQPLQNGLFGRGVSRK